jgi:AcrR family transcriptional regulator
MARTYTLKRRAESQAETRRRIVEAAVDLHGTVGPAATTVSMIAERAGVQRHTVYAHFPDDRSMLLACSGLVAERDPLPEAEPWRAIADARARLRTGLGALYAWYERNAGLTARVLRDAEVHPLTREIVALRWDGRFADYRAVLGEALAPDAARLLAVALSYFTWQTLTADNRLTSAAAAELMARTVACGET